MLKKLPLFWKEDCSFRIISSKRILFWLDWLLTFLTDDKFYTNITSDISLFKFCDELLQVFWLFEMLLSFSEFIISPSNSFIWFLLWSPINDDFMMLSTNNLRSYILFSSKLRWIFLLNKRFYCVIWARSSLFWFLYSSFCTIFDF